MNDKINEMKLYHMFQTNEFRGKFYPFIEQVKKCLKITRKNKKILLKLNF